MVKFIVEVDEEYIHKNADFGLIAEQAKSMGGITSLFKVAEAVGAKCDDHRADCQTWEAKPTKTVRKRGGKMEVTFK